MNIDLIEMLVNYYERNANQLIVIYDDNVNVRTFTFGNIPDDVKQMKVERFVVVSEKLTIIKVEGVINEQI